MACETLGDCFRPTAERFGVTRWLRAAVAKPGAHIEAQDLQTYCREFSHLEMVQGRAFPEGTPEKYHGEGAKGKGERPHPRLSNPFAITVYREQRST
jgi:hypothetical protein